MRLFGIGKGPFDDIFFVVRFGDGKYLQHPESYGEKYRRTENLDDAVKLSLFGNNEFALVGYGINEPYNLVKVKEHRTYEFVD